MVTEKPSSACMLAAVAGLDKKLTRALIRVTLGMMMTA